VQYDHIGNSPLVVWLPECNLVRRNYKLINSWVKRLISRNKEIYYMALKLDRAQGWLSVKCLVRLRDWC